MDAIVAEGVEKAYGDTVALDDVSLSVGRGEVFALVGPNGAGKTTLVRCLVGTTSPDVGSVRLLGGSPGRADRSAIGFLPQSYRPPTRLTVRELFDYFSGLYDESRPVEVLLEDVGLADAAQTRYSDLSGGQQRRVCVGAAIVNDPAVLFLDEPTTGIDPAGRRSVWRLVESLAAGGTTVLLTTHDMGEVERLSDRVGVLVEARLRAVGSPAELVATHGGSSQCIVDTQDAPIQLSGYSVTETDRGWRIEGVSPDQLGEIVRALDRGGIEYRKLSWREPDLETVYLELTGRAPRTAEVVE